MSSRVFVDWRAVNETFRGLMWVLAGVLALVILLHECPTAPPLHHAVVHGVVR